MPTAHQRIIAELTTSDPGIRTRGFKKAAKAFALSLDSEEREIGQEDLEAIQDYVAFVPDAFKLDAGAEEIHIYEVVSTNPISDTKKWKLAWGWWIFDYVYISVRLFVLDIYGNRAEIQLEEWHREVVSSDKFPKGRPVSSHVKRT